MRNGRRTLAPRRCRRRDRARQHRSVRHLHPQINRGRTGTGIQFPGCAAGGRRSVHPEPARPGTVHVPEHYDDGGFSGGNLDRPALQRLLSDIEAGKVQCVVVYKVDRLSRSLMDFARIIAVFEKHNVSFVSVTQQFNTTNSLGRLTLNILLSFAQFEREIIAERTRDKMSAARRKGKWTGGHPMLGYDIDPRGGRLVVNADEAHQVRTIFELYLDYKALLPVVREIDRRGWRTKQWVTKKRRDARRQAVHEGPAVPLADEPDLHRQDRFSAARFTRASTKAIVEAGNLGTGAADPPKKWPQRRRRRSEQLRRPAEGPDPVRILRCGNGPHLHVARDRGAIDITSASERSKTAGPVARRNRFPPLPSNRRS